ncbi:MAG: tRNA (adenosine(37)-N6)-dimethylallyltransferase MiaA [Simkaniaceae bacterium]|nr:tRNA (adenosine(37)-N6)-dimethylallyltransferase MiaA [Simkaniaceae bacterium]
MHDLRPLPQMQKLPLYLSGKGVLVIAGPTATGKSAISIEIAKKIRGEIISADSMQVYRGMNIGTAKITKGEMEGIPHHLIDIVDVASSFTVMDYYQAATQTIRDIHARGNIPIVVGGTGFYIHTLIYGPPGGPPASPQIRERLEDELRLLGAQAMYDRLKNLDLEYALTIGFGDRQKIVRALEIITLTNKKVSDFPKFRADAHPKEFDFRCHFIYYPKDILYERIDHRCDEMVKQGFPEEVERLERNGLRENLSASQAIGYKQYLDFLDSDQHQDDWDQFIWSFKLATRRFAKRQFTWFRKEPLFQWTDCDLTPREEVLKIILS